MRYKQAVQKRMQLPAGASLLDASPPASNWMQELDAFMQRHEVSEGYIQVTANNREDLLLLFRGRPYVAGRYADGRCQRLDLTRFFHDAQQTQDLRVQICKCDLGLTLVLAVLFQHDPTLRVPLKLADVERIIGEVKKNGQDAAIVLVTPHERSFAFCRKGQIASVYLADPEAASDEATLADRFMSYLYTRPTGADTLVEVYHELTVSRDAHSNRQVKDFMIASIDPLPVFLRVLKGREVTEKRLIRDGQIRIGRNPDNDVVINHPSVSREHTHIFWRNGAYHVQDLKSANGTLINGQSIQEGQLHFGDRLKLGDFEVAFEGEPTEGGEEEELHTLFIDAPALQSISAQIVKDGQTFRIEMPVYTIGKSKTAHLRLHGGFFIRDVQATIVREGPGKYRLSAAEGGRAVTINGEKIAFSGALLNSGDQFTIGPHTMLFALVAQT